MAQTPPPDVDVLPPTPSTDSPSTFEARMDNHLAAQPVFREQLIALAENCYDNAVDAYNNAVLSQNNANTAIAQAAAASVYAANAQTAANNASLAANAPLWVANTNYPANYVVTGPLTGLSYRRLIAGAGITDPSLDTTNWRAVVLDVITNMPVIRPSLLLDFANAEQVDSRVTFTRASTATRVNTHGLIELVGIHEPRIDYDPLTGKCYGVLIEEVRTNLSPYSEQFDDGSWNNYLTTVTANVTVSPSGTISADKLIATSASGVHSIYRTITVSSGATVALSFFVSPAEYGRYVRLYVDTVGGIAFYGDYDLVLLTQTTSVGASGVVLRANITQFKNGICRLDLTGSLPGNTTYYLHVAMRNNSNQATFSGDGTSGIGLWGLQAEAGEFPTSYIQTTSGAVGRAADIATMTGQDFSSWYREDEYTIVVTFIANAYGTRTVFSISDGTSNERIYLQSISGVTTLNVVDGGVSQAALALGTLVHGTIYTVAIAWKLNDIAASVNGATVVTDSAATLPTPTTLCLGTDYAYANALNSHISSFVGFPKRLTNSELQSLSTQ